MTDYTHLTDEDLWARVNEVSGVDRINVLVELADRAFPAGEFGEALALLEEASTAMDQVDDRQRFAEILYGQAAAAFHAGQLDTAVDCYGRAAQIFRELGVLRAAAHALLCQADAYCSLGNVEQCLTTARKAGVLAESESDSAQAGEACCMQAAALQRLGRDQDALCAYQSSSQHFQHAGCHEQVMQVNDLIASALLRLGQVDAALEVAREGLTLAHRFQADASLTHLRLAEVLQRTGQHSRAMEEAEAAQREYRKVGDLTGEAFVCFAACVLNLHDDSSTWLGWTCCGRRGAWLYAVAASACFTRPRVQRAALRYPTPQDRSSLGARTTSGLTHLTERAVHGAPGGARNESPRTPTSTSSRGKQTIRIWRQP